MHAISQTILSSNTGDCCGTQRARLKSSGAGSDPDRHPKATSKHTANDDGPTDDSDDTEIWLAPDYGRGSRQLCILGSWFRDRSLCAVFCTTSRSLNTEQITPMALLSILLLLIARLSMVVVCGVQDEWKAPKSPDFSSKQGRPTRSNGHKTFKLKFQPRAQVTL